VHVVIHGFIESLVKEELKLWV